MERPEAGTRAIALGVVLGAALLWILQIVSVSAPQGSPVHYELLSDAYLAGQLHLLEGPSPELLSLENPYDVDARAGVAWMWDASLYEGRYYLYFSPVPALLAYVPARLLTGSYPPGQLVAFVFMMIATAANVSTVRLVAPGVSGVRAGVLYGVVAVASFLPSQLHAGHVWSLAVLSGHLFASAFLYTAARLWLEPEQRGLWVAAGLCCGLMGASRPSLAPLGAVYLVLGARAWWAGADRRWLLGSAAPLVLIGSLMLGHNQVRYGSPFEFGEKYQLNSADMLNHKFCHLADAETLPHLVNNVPQYLFLPPSLSAAPPFVGYRRARLLPEDAAIIRFPPQPLGGLLVFFPFLGLGLLGMALADREDPRVQFAWTSALGALGTLTLVSTCAWIVVRYQIDYVPALAVPAALGVVQVARRSEVLEAVAYAALMVSLGMGVLLGWVPAG